MGSDTFWMEPRSPGQIAGREVDGPGGRVPRQADGATVLMAPFVASNWIVLPPETPHRLAGQPVRVTAAFFSADPTTGQGRVAHVWCQDARLGVAECPAGFVVYELPDDNGRSWPWPIWKWKGTEAIEAEALALMFEGQLAGRNARTETT